MLKRLALAGTAFIFLEHHRSVAVSTAHYQPAIVAQGLPPLFDSESS
jgi:hypothetical protein